MKRRLDVLVIEEKEGSAAGLLPALRAEGCVVRVADNPQSGVEAARAVPPDVVLVELTCRGPDSVAVVRQLHDQYAWRRPLLVALTSEADREACHCLRQVGVDLHLAKPVEPKQLVLVLRRFGAMLADLDGFDPGL